MCRWKIHLGPKGCNRNSSSSTAVLIKASVALAIGNKLERLGQKKDFSSLVGHNCTEEKIEGLKGKMLRVKPAEGSNPNSRDQCAKGREG